MGEYTNTYQHNGLNWKCSSFHDEIVLWSKHSEIFVQYFGMKKNLWWIRFLELFVLFSLVYISTAGIHKEYLIFFRGMYDCEHFKQEF